MSSDDRAVSGEPPADPTSGAGERAPATSERPADPTRRQFFRAFGRQTVAGAGNVLGAAEALRRGGTAAAGELVGLGFGSPQQNAARMQAAAELVPTPLADGQRFSSPYAYSDEAIVLLDQRRLPGERATVTCTEASEVAAALRAGVVTGGPILAEIAAHTLVMAGRRRFDIAAETLRAARPTARAIPWAVERMRTVPEGASLRREAEAIAMEAALDHARLGRLGTEAPPVADSRLELLFHGEMGPLSCGLVGTGFALVRSLLDAGREVHVRLTDGGPWLRGGALSAMQLAQLDVPHTVIPDAAVGWLIQNRRLDAVLIRLDAIGGDGESLAPIGALNVARLAAAEGVPVLGCATTAAVDMAGPLPQPRELAPAGERRVEPLADAVPASLLDAILTEEGPLRPPYADSIAAAVASRSARRVAEAVTGASA